MEAGRVIDRYEVLGTLGEGGMAQVVRVRHTTLKTVHALKVLTVSGKGLTDRLVAEGQAQAQLQHVNVVRVSDVIDVDGQPGLVMDFVDGPDLDRWILETKPDPELAEEVFRGVLAGVMAAHHAGVIHRDLKPANVLMAKDAAGHWVPKVADFGLAKAIQSEDSLKKTRTGLPMGTPAYMSPEQIRNAAGVDARADIFSLGCILHELLTHDRAFEGEDAISIFNAVIAGQRQQPTGTPISTRLQTVIDGCLVPDRDARLPSCEAVAALLDRDDAPALDLSQPPPPWMMGVMAGGVALLGLVLVLGGAAVFAGIWAMTGELPDAVAELPEVLGGGDGCSTRDDGSIGWIRQSTLPPRPGRTWRARTDTDVHAGAAGREHHDEVVCTLPGGASAKVMAKEGPWLQLEAASLTLPETEAP